MSGEGAGRRGGEPAEGLERCAAGYRGSGSSGSARAGDQSSNYRSWAPRDVREPQTVTLVGKKDKEVSGEAVDDSSGAQQDRGAKRRASNSGDRDVSSGSQEAQASGPGAGAPEAPTDRGGAVAPSGGAGGGLQIARRWNQSEPQREVPVTQLPADGMKDWFREIAKVMLEQKERALPVEPSWKGSWWSSG